MLIAPTVVEGWGESLRLKSLLEWGGVRTIDSPETRVILLHSVYHTHLPASGLADSEIGLVPATAPYPKALT